MTTSNASVLPRPTTRRAELLRSLGKAPWAVGDQMVISAANFATMVFLARGLSQAEFGGFTLAYSALLFANTLQSGLVAQPHNILGVTLRGRDYVRFTTSTAVSQAGLAAATALLSLAAWGVARFAAPGSAPLLLAMAPAMVAWQFQEFARRVFYTEGRVASAFTVDLISYAALVLAVLALQRAGALTGANALYAHAGAFSLAAALGLWQLRDRFAGPFDAGVVRENWHFGKWLAAGDVVGHWLSTQLFVYLAAAMLGAAAAGVLRAIHTVFGPTRVLIFVFNTLLPIRLARALADEGRPAFRARLASAFLVALPLLGGYCLLAAVFSVPVLRLLYGDKYAAYPSVLALYAAFTFVSYATMILTAALRAQRLSRFIFTSRLAATLVTVPFGCVLIRLLGVNGAVLGSILTAAVLAYFSWQAYRRNANDEPPPTPGDRESITGPTATTANPDLLGPTFPANPGPTTGGGAILGRLFEALDRAGVPYCVTHGYETYPDRIPSDVDCLVPAGAHARGIPALLHAERESIGAEVVQRLDGETLYLVLAGKEEGAGPGGGPAFVPLDLSTDFEVKKRFFLGGDEVVKGRRRRGGFWVPAAHVEFGCYLARKVAKGRLDEEHGRRLAELFRLDPDGCRRQIARYWSPAGAGKLAEAAETGDWAAVRTDLRRLRAELVGKATLRHPLRWLRNLADDAAQRARRWLRPAHGLSVVFLGPDGAGKSSVVRSVARRWAPAFFRTDCRTFPPALLNRGPEVTCATPHDVPPRSFAASVVRAVLYWFVYYGPGYLVTARPALARFTLLLHDRHLVDAIVDPKRYRYTGPAWLLRLIWRLIPKPDLVILLDGPAALIQSRKREVSVAETERQCAAYRALVATMPNGHVVDASGSMGRVAADVDSIIHRYLADRVERRRLRGKAGG